VYIIHTKWNWAVCFFNFLSHNWFSLPKWCRYR